MTDNYCPADEIVAIVDGNNALTGGSSRSEMRRKGLLHRVTYLLIFNTLGELLVQTRTLTKDVFPGMIDLAAGGVVLENESYAQSAQRELNEELGIDVPLKFHFEIYYEQASAIPPNRNWGYVFSGISDGPFTLQKEEVANAEFMRVEDVLAMDSSGITPDTRQVLLTYLL